MPIQRLNLTRVTKDSSGEELEVALGQVDQHIRLSAEIVRVGRMIFEEFGGEVPAAETLVERIGSEFTEDERVFLESEVRQLVVVVEPPVETTPEAPAAPAETPVEAPASEDTIQHVEEQRTHTIELKAPPPKPLTPIQQVFARLNGLNAANQIFETIRKCLTQQKQGFTMKAQISEPSQRELFGYISRMLGGVQFKTMGIEVLELYMIGAVWGLLKKEASGETDVSGGAAGVSGAGAADVSGDAPQS
jgi:hypothetical protein